MTEKNIDNAALEEAYEKASKEISLALQESKEQPPEELLDNVMQAISAKDINFDEYYERMPFEQATAAEQTLRIEVKKTAIDDAPSFEFRLLTRYVPIAACLAVVLLTLGYLGVFNQQQYNEMSEAPPMNVMMDAAQEAAVEEAVIAVDEAATASDISPAIASDEADALADDAAPAPAEAETREFEVTFEADNDTNRGGYMKITAEEALMLMGLAEQYVILDVRTEEEFSGTRIKDAMLIPYDEISSKAHTMIPETDQMIFVYCQSGVRSARAAETLNEMGYTQVFDIGGITDWPYDTEG